MLRQRHDDEKMQNEARQSDEQRNGYYMSCSISLLGSLRLVFSPSLIYALLQHPLIGPPSPSRTWIGLTQAAMLSLLLLVLVSQSTLSASLATVQQRQVGQVGRAWDIWRSGYSYPVSRKSRSQLLARASVPSGWTCVLISPSLGKCMLMFPHRVRYAMSLCV